MFLDRLKTTRAVQYPFQIGGAPTCRFALKVCPRCSQCLDLITPRKRLIDVIQRIASRKWNSVASGLAEQKSIDELTSPIQNLLRLTDL